MDLLLPLLRIQSSYFLCTPVIYSDDFQINSREILARATNFCCRLRGK